MLRGEKVLLYVHDVYVYIVLLPPFRHVEGCRGEHDENIGNNVYSHDLLFQ